MRIFSYKQAWTIWLITSLFSLFQFFLQVASNMMTTQYMQTFHITAAGVGTLSSAFFYSYVVVQVPAGLLYDHFHLKKVALTAASICGLGCALFSVSPNFYCAFLSRLLMGAGGGFAFVGMVFACAEVFPPKFFTLTVGLGELVGMLGTSIGQKVVPHFVLQFGWRSVMLGCACLALALVCTMSIVLKNVPKDSQNQTSLWSKIVDSGKQVSRIPTVWLAGVFCCGMFAVVTTFASLWGVPFLEAVHHISYINATSNIAFILLGIAIGGPTAGWLFGRSASPKALMVGFSLGALCCTLLVLYSHVSNGLLYAGLLGMGLFCSIYVTAFSVVERATPAAIRGTAIGLCNAIALLGAIIFQPLIGWLVLHMQHNHPITDIAKTYQVSLSVLPGLMLIAIISAFALPKLSPKPESDAINESEQSIGPSLNEIIFKHNLANLGQYDT